MSADCCGVPADLAKIRAELYAEEIDEFIDALIDVRGHHVVHIEEVLDTIPDKPARCETCEFLISSFDGE